MKDKFNFKILILILIIMPIIIAFIIGITVGKVKFTTNGACNNTNKNEDFAKLIIDKFNIEAFFYDIHPNSDELNDNLLEKYLNTFIFNQKNIKKYTMEYKETNYEFNSSIIPSLTETITVIKYNDYIATYKNVFNKEYNSTEITQNNDLIKFENMNLKSNIYFGKYDIYIYDEITKCTLNELNRCYIITDWQENTAGGYFPPQAILKNYKVEGNKIKGDIFYQEISEDTPNKYGTFELKYTEKDDNYYIESLKVTSIFNKN